MVGVLIVQPRMVLVPNRDKKRHIAKRQRREAKTALRSENRRGELRGGTVSHRQRMHRVAPQLRAA